MFWYLIPSDWLQYIYQHDGQLLVLGRGPEIVTDDGYEPTDLDVIHGPQPA